MSEANLPREFPDEALVLWECVGVYKDDGE